MAPRPIEAALDLPEILMKLQNRVFHCGDRFPDLERFLSAFQDFTTGQIQRGILGMVARGLSELELSDAVD